MYQHKKLDNRLLGDQIEDELMKYILEEPIEIGNKIPNEFELAEMFGVGRSTIREAVKGLVSKGVLEVRRGSGTYVISTNSVDNDPLGLSRQQDKYKLALDLFEVRLMLEPEIAANAAKNATEEDLEQLKYLCDETEKIYLSGKNHISKDIDFHTCIAMCSKNEVVEILIPIINTAVMTFANLTHRTLRDETIRTHRAVTNAIIDRDPTGAKCAMIMHLTYNRQALLRMRKEKQKSSDELKGENV